MSSPSYCAACGHALGIGRFCTNCGRPVPGRHPEAEPVAGTPTTSPTAVEPPPATGFPPAPRYPLFADGGDDGHPGPASPPPPPSTAPAATAAAPGGSFFASAGEEYHATTAHDPARRSGLVLWVAAAVVIALLVTLGGFLVLRDGSSDAADDPTSGGTGSAASPSAGEGSPGDASGGASDGASDGGEQPPDESALPDAAGTDGPVPAPASVSDLASRARAEVPSEAAPSRDTANRPVTFVAGNLVDDDPRTAWRMAGDGTGSVLTFDLGTETVLTEVGLINGYAKVDGPNDWYPSNRRVRQVQWEFDDGTRVTQRLERDRTLQSIPVGPVRTTTVRLRILEVSAPGKKNGRDFTALSQVSLVGAAAGDDSDDDSDDPGDDSGDD